MQFDDVDRDLMPMGFGDAVGFDDVYGFNNFSRFCPLSSSQGSVAGGPRSRSKGPLVPFRVMTIVAPVYLAAMRLVWSQLNIHFGIRYQSSW
jgi:hypothetical protein